MSKRTHSIEVIQELLAEIKGLKRIIMSLIPLFVFDGLCQQCGGKGEHEGWCLVGKAEEAAK